MLTRKEYAKNMSLMDKIKGYKNYVLNYVRFFNRYRLRYRNYLVVTLNILRGKYPLQATLHDGQERTFACYEEVYSDLMHLAYDSEQDITYFDGLVFHGGLSSGDVSGIFIDKEYFDLNVKEKVIIDVGASIGDSAIFFAQQGAKKVLAVEPDRRSYEFAKKNVEVNGFADRISVVWAGISTSPTFDPDPDKPPLISLGDVIDKYCPDATTLKLDCEGCEYDIILTETREIISKFTQIILEYHYGYRNLKKKLEEFDYLVKCNGPIYFLHRDKETTRCPCYGNKPGFAFHNKEFFGMLYAQRIAYDYQGQIIS